MGDFSAKAMLRFALLKEGIPFDDLEPKSPIEVVGSSSKSLAESIMYNHGISVQDLKKGTFYEHLENGEKIEDIEKKKMILYRVLPTKAKTKKEKKKMNLENGEKIEDIEKKKMKDEVDDIAIAMAMAMEKDMEMYGDYDMEKVKEIYRESEMAMEKDKEMYGDLDKIVKKTKMMKKIEKIEKKKLVKIYGDEEKRRAKTRPPT